jgi:hypothetical protein
MADETIRFFDVPTDSGLLAVAEVTLFPGVSLRGWMVFQQNDEIEVLPPHQIYREPDSEEESRFDLLRFQNEQTRRVWLNRVKEEFIRWRKKAGTEGPRVG